MQTGKEQILLDGISVAPGVIETIAVLACEHVEGVTGVCARPALRKNATAPALEVAITDGDLTCSVHIQSRFGVELIELGKAVQNAICDAMEVQIGIRPSKVEVFIDSIVAQ